MGKRSRISLQSYSNDLTITITIQHHSHILQCITILTPTLYRGSLLTEIPFLLPSRRKLPTKRIGSRQTLTDRSESLALHISLEVALHTATATVVREADERAVFILIQRCGVGQSAY